MNANLRHRSLVCLWLLAVAAAGGEIDLSTGSGCSGTMLPGPRPRCVPLDQAALRSTTLAAPDVISLMPERFDASPNAAPVNYGNGRPRPEPQHAYFSASDIAGGRPDRKTPLGWDNYVRLTEGTSPRQEAGEAKDAVNRLYVFSLRSTERIESVQKLYEAVDVPAGPGGEGRYRFNRWLVAVLVFLTVCGTAGFWLFARRR